MPIEDKIVNCSLILEAFGNAKTIRNYNSSRFGKYVRIWMEKTAKKIREADITNYLLEKSRISMQALGERNYHIFYHFLRGASQSLLDQFSLTKDLNYYEYLNKSGCYDAENIDDIALFQGVCDCFDQMKFNKEEIFTIWSVLAAILKLGNLEFNDAEKTDDKPCKIINEALFVEISKLLSIETEILRSALTIKMRITDKEKFFCPLEKYECVSVRDSFSKCLYDKVFNWIIKRLNLSIRNEKIDVENKNLSIGLLDIFGFEDFKINSLEQFCINFTNEKLQQLYINYIFKSEQKEFIEQGLENSFGQITYQDNQAVIDLFDKPPYGIFLLLDESTTLKSSEDKRLLETIVKTHKENICFKAPKSVIETFLIQHSAKNVEYNITGFRRKNKDEINQEIEDAIINSKDPNIYNVYMGECMKNKEKEEALEESKELMIMKSITMTSMEKSKGPSKNLKSSMNSKILGESKSSPKRTGKSMGGIDKFLGTKFRNQMRQLMDELMQCDAHFIRCLKPNEEKKSDCFVNMTALLQIRYLGLLDAIKIRKNTYPARREYKDFYQKYQEILKGRGGKNYIQEIKEGNYRYLSEEIVRIGLGEEKNNEILYGKHKIYLKADAEDLIDTIFVKMWKKKQEMVKKIWKQYKVYRWRSCLLKKLNVLYKRMKKFRKFQAICKGKRIRKRFNDKKKAVGHILTINKTIMRKLLNYFFRKYQNMCKLKSLCLIAQKKQREKNIKEKFERVEKIYDRGKKGDWGFLKKQCDLKKKCALEKQRNEEEELKKKMKEEEERRIILEKKRKEEEKLKKKQKEDEENSIIEKQRKAREELKKKDEEKTILIEKQRKKDEELKKKNEENKVLFEKQRKDDEELMRNLEEKKVLLEKQIKEEEKLKKKEEENIILREKQRNNEKELNKKQKEEEEYKLSLEKQRKEDELNRLDQKQKAELLLAKNVEEPIKVEKISNVENYQELSLKKEFSKVNNSSKMEKYEDLIKKEEKNSEEPANLHQSSNTDKPKFTNEMVTPKRNITPTKQNSSFQDRLKMFNQPKSANETPVKSKKYKIILNLHYFFLF